MITPLTTELKRIYATVSEKELENNPLIRRQLHAMLATMSKINSTYKSSEQFTRQKKRGGK